MTHKELFEALLAGKKLRKSGLSPHDYIKLDFDGNLTLCDGILVGLVHPDKYTIYEEPTYQVLYSYVNTEGKTIYDTTIDAFSSKENFINSKYSRGRNFIKLLD